MKCVMRRAKCARALKCGKWTVNCKIRTWAVPHPMSHDVPEKELKTLGESDRVGAETKRPGCDA